MIVERNENDGIGNPSQPKRAQVMKIAGTVYYKRSQTRLEFPIKVLDQARGCGKTQSRAPSLGIDHWQIERFRCPGVIQIKMESEMHTVALTATMIDNFPAIT